MSLVCWKCGESLKDIPKPFGRLERCPHCHADLHVCVMCCFYNPRMSDKCDHEMAERARESDIANFCHYYKPKPDAFNGNARSTADDAMQQLKALFGEDAAGEKDADETGIPKESHEEAKKRFDELFKNDE